MNNSLQLIKGLFFPFSSINFGAMATSLGTVGSMITLMTLTGCSQPASESTATTPQPESQPTTQTETTVDDSKQSTDKKNGEHYTVLTQLDFIPFIFRGEDGTLTGFDIDIIKAVAENQGFSIDIVTRQDDLFSHMINRKYDILVASLSITEERKKIIEFSDPYFESHQTILLNDTVPKVNSFKELTKYKIAAEPDTTSGNLLKEVFADTPENVQNIDSLFLGVRSVISGDVDGVMSDSGVIQHYKRKNADKNLHVFTDLSYPAEYYAFAVSKDRDDDLLQKINTGLAGIKSDGTYQKIEENWFGTTTLQ